MQFQFGYYLWSCSFYDINLHSVEKKLRNVNSIYLWSEIHSWIFLFPLTLSLMIGFFQSRGGTLPWDPHLQDQTKWSIVLCFVTQDIHSELHTRVTIYIISSVHYLLFLFAATFLSSCGLSAKALLSFSADNTLCLWAKRGKKFNKSLIWSIISPGYLRKTFWRCSWFVTSLKVALKIKMSTLFWTFQLQPQNVTSCVVKTSLHQSFQTVICISSLSVNSPQIRRRVPKHTVYFDLQKKRVLLLVFTFSPRAIILFERVTPLTQPYFSVTALLKCLWFTCK